MIDCNKIGKLQTPADSFGKEAFSVCDMWRTKDALTKHIQLHAEAKPMPYACPVCCGWFFHEEYLMHHVDKCTEQLRQREDMNLR